MKSPGLKRTKDTKKHEGARRNPSFLRAPSGVLVSFVLFGSMSTCFSSISAFPGTCVIFCRTVRSGRRITRVAMLTRIARSSSPWATAAPMAPVAQIEAAVAVPLTAWRSLRIAPPPTKSIPVISPSRMRACASASPPMVRAAMST